MLPDLAKDYSNLIKVDVAQEISPIQDVVDDLITRLEETESIISMIQTEQEQEDILPDLIQCNNHLQQLEFKVDKVTAFLSHVAREVNLLQTRVINAEQDFPVQANEGSFSSLLKFINPSMSPSPSVPRSSNLNYEPQDIFKTSDFFPTQSSGKPEPETKES